MDSMFTAGKMSDVSKNRGFTIIEMLVSVGIFAIVMTVGMGSLIAVIRAGGAAQASQALTSDLSFELDGMSRKIRTGYSYYCADDVEDSNSLYLSTIDCVSTGGASAIAFTDGETGNRMAYRFDATTLSIQQRIDEYDSDSKTYTEGSWFSISSEQTQIESLTFIVENTESAPDDEVQPVIRILIKGKSGEASAAESSFFIQTSVSSRSLDV